MTKEVYGIIYMIKNNVNNKIYFGQTIRDFDNRYCGNLEKNTHNTHLKSSIEKYGIENFTIVKEFDIAYSKTELDQLEDMYVKIWNTTNDSYGYNKKFGGTNGRPNLQSRRKMSIAQSGSNSAVAKKVVCLNNGLIFQTAEEGAQWAGVDRSSVIKCCKGKRHYAGRDALTNVSLQWCYYDDFTSGNYVYIKGYGQYICLNNLRVFSCLKECSDYSGVSVAKISTSANNTSKHAGTDMCGNKIYWMKYNDYLKNNNKGEVLYVK